MAKSRQNNNKFKVKNDRQKRLLDLKNSLERINREKVDKARRLLLKKCNEKRNL